MSALANLELGEGTGPGYALWEAAWPGGRRSRMGRQWACWPACCAGWRRVAAGRRGDLGASSAGSGGAGDCRILPV